jgi:hypothetical protein
MFVIHMPKTLKVGDTVACRINGEPQRQREGAAWRLERRIDAARRSGCSAKAHQRVGLR